MKNLSKLIISIGAVAVASAALALSALAVDTVNGTYDPKTGVVTLDPFDSTGDQQTLLVLTEDVEAITSENSDVIAQVDQDTSITSFVLEENLTSGTYYIRIGGTNGEIRTGTLTIGSGVDTVTIKVGDANLDDLINASDVGYIMRCSNKYTTRIGNAGESRIKASDNSEVVIGDANLDGNINASDVGYVMRYSNKYTSRTGNSGEEIEVLKVEE